MKLRNFTPHELEIYLENRTITLPSEGSIRLKQREEIVEEINGIPVVKVVYDEPTLNGEALPSQQSDGIWVVSSIVAPVLQQMGFRVLVPNTGPTQLGAIRDTNGRIVGVKSLIRP